MSIEEQKSSDGVDRRGFLRCMTWAGAGVVWTLKSGILQSQALGAEAGKPAEFDTVAEVMKSIRTGQSFYVPGEHDYFVDDGKQYLERFGKGTRGTGWQS